MCGNELFSVKANEAAVFRYFGLLSKTGASRPASLRHLLVRLFVLDMLTYAQEFITETDYELFKMMLHNLESMDCLLPYSVFCTNRTVYGINGEDGEDYAGPIR